MPSIGASSVMGVALESTPGTYVAPTKFIPFESESLNYTQDTNWRRPIRNTAGIVGAAPGNAHVEGDLEMEALSDVVALLLHASRCTVTKTGTAPNFQYVFVPAPVAVPTKTMSVSIRRGAEVFGYVGCVISSFTLTIDDSGAMKFSCSIVGNNEASQSALTGIVWPTTSPFGVGQYSIEIPTSTQVFDCDNFEFQSEDNADPQFRLKNTTGAQFVAFGESNATISVERDFETRTDYDSFKALTAQSLTMVATQSANSEIAILMPVAIKDSYEVSIGGQGDLIRASVTYNGVIDATGKHYEITVKTAENITL